MPLCYSNLQDRKLEDRSEEAKTGREHEAFTYLVVKGKQKSLTSIPPPHVLQIIYVLEMSLRVRKLRKPTSFKARLPYKWFCNSTSERWHRRFTKSSNLKGMSP